MIWRWIHHVPTPEHPQKYDMYDLIELASCNDGQFGVLLNIYACAGENIGDRDIGIKHAASWAYKKLGDKKLLKPDSSVVLSLVFKDTFLPLMKALLRSRVIAKSPLSNASDIRRLRRAKDAFEAKGYERKGVVKLLIVTHRLRTSDRMAQFVQNIPSN